MPVDFAAAIKTAEKEGHISGGDYFKFKEGDNRFRLVSECLPHPGSYNGKPNFKWFCYVIDRADGQIKTFFMPHTIYKQIAELQKSEEYAFFDIPVPYDISVKAKAAGTKEVEYTLVPARKNTPLTAAEEAELRKKKPLAEVQTTIFAKNSANSTNGTTDMERAAADHFDPDNVPDEYPAKTPVPF